MKKQNLFILFIFLICVISVLCDDSVKKNKKTRKKIKRKPQADAPLPTRQGDDYDENYDYYDGKEDYVIEEDRNGGKDEREEETTEIFQQPDDEIPTGISFVLFANIHFIYFFSKYILAMPPIISVVTQRPTPAQIAPSKFNIL